MWISKKRLANINFGIIKRDVEVQTLKRSLDMMQSAPERKHTYRVMTDGGYVTVEATGKHVTSDNSLQFFLEAGPNLDRLVAAFPKGQWKWFVIDDPKTSDGCCGGQKKK